MGYPPQGQGSISGGASIPSGLIAVWHGSLSNIPSGWVLCDGNNSTPNLLARFVRSVPNASTNPGSTGGEDSHTLTVAEMPGHAHSCNCSTSAGSQNGTFARGASSGTSQDTGSAGGGGSHENRPAYYEVAFIMKT